MVEVPVWHVIGPAMMWAYTHVTLVWVVLGVLIILWVTGGLKRSRYWLEARKRDFLYGQPKYDDPEVLERIKRERALKIAKAQKEAEEATKKYLEEQEELKKLKEQREAANKETDGPSVHFGGATGGSHWKPPQKCGPSG